MIRKILLLIIVIVSFLGAVLSCSANPEEIITFSNSMLIILMVLLCIAFVFNYSPISSFCKYWKEGVQFPLDYSRIVNDNYEEKSYFFEYFNYDGKIKININNLEKAESSLFYYFMIFYISTCISSLYGMIIKYGTITKESIINNITLYLIEIYGVLSSFVSIFLFFYVIYSAVALSKLRREGIADKY